MNKIFFNPTAAVIITLLILVFWFSLYQTVQDFHSSKDSLDQLQEEVVKLGQDVGSLEENIDQAKSDENKEKLSRNELLMQKEGEYIVKLETKNQKEETKSEIVEKKLTPWEAWREVVF